MSPKVTRASWILNPLNSMGGVGNVLATLRIERHADDVFGADLRIVAAHERVAQSIVADRPLSTGVHDGLRLDLADLHVDSEEPVARDPQRNRAQIRAARDHGASGKS